MCRCNQGGRRVDHLGIKAINLARSMLMLARKEKQDAEVARDYAENGGPEYMFTIAETHETLARNSRLHARETLRELEIRYGKAYVKSLAGSYTSANKLNGRRFQTWSAYRNLFDHDTKGSLDTWQ